MAANGTRKHPRKGTPLTPGEKRRLRQLVVCLVLFGVVFLGRGTDFGPLAQLSSTVGELVRADTDFQAVFAQMGESFSKGEPAVETFRSLWDGVFPTEETNGASASRTPGPRGGSRPNRANGRRGGPRGGSFIAQADSG